MQFQGYLAQDILEVDDTFQEVQVMIPSLVYGPSEMWESLNNFVQGTEIDVKETKEDHADFPD